MSRSLWRVVAAMSILLATPGMARAGMPSATLNDLAKLRIQAISFFLAVLFGSAWAVRLAWNALAKDFPRLPRLSMGRAIGLVTLWGLLFGLVLTMISGARELMTPGAWRKDGFTYKLADTPAPTVDDLDEAARRSAIDRLRVALWTYAASHDGRFPADDKAPEIPADAWIVPDPSGIRYRYVGGQVSGKGASPLAFEPGIFGAGRFMLLTDGTILKTDGATLGRMVDGEGTR